MATWLVVAEQVNPPQTVRIDNIPLRTTGLDKDLLIVSNIPATVSAVVQAPQNYRGRPLAAELSRHRQPGSVWTPTCIGCPSMFGLLDDQVRVITREPGSLDMELQPSATRAMTVALVIPDRDTLPFSYEISGNPTVTPAQVTGHRPGRDRGDAASGPRSAWHCAARAAASTRSRPVVLKDAKGNVLTGLITDPETVQVTQFPSANASTPATPPCMW